MSTEVVFKTPTRKGQKGHLEPKQNQEPGGPPGPSTLGEYGPDDKECTFHPRINPISRTMASYMKPLQSEEGINFYLERKNRKLDKLKEQYMKEQEQKDPVMQENLARLRGRAKELEDVGLRLYNRGREMLDDRDKFREEFLKDTCPFVPNAERYKGESNGGIRNFLKRNQIDCRMRDLKHGRRIYCPKNDLELKTPNEGREPKYRTKEGKTGTVVGQELYLRGLEKAKEREAEASKRPLTPPPGDSKTRAANEKYLKKLLSRRFEDIYFMLDSSQTGSLTSETANVEALHPTLLKTMAELLFEIEDFNLRLERPQFVRACFNLYESLDFYGRHILLSHPLQSSQEREGGKTVQDEFGNNTSIRT